MMIEDDPVIAKTVGETLTSWGMEVYCVEDFQNVMAEFTSFSPQLVLLVISPLRALLFVVYLIILQQLEGNLIYPRVVGGSIGLPGLWVLAAVTVGGGVSGITGMLLGVPVTATVYKLLKNDLHRREQLPPPANS